MYNGPTPKYLTIPTEYCWVQTYLTYSYYENKKYLLYKNMGMLLSRLLEWNGKPNPLKYYNKIKVFRYVVLCGNLTGNAFVKLNDVDCSNVSLYLPQLLFEGRRFYVAKDRAAILR